MRPYPYGPAQSQQELVGSMVTPTSGPLVSPLSSRLATPSPTAVPPPPTPLPTATPAPTPTPLPPDPLLGIAVADSSDTWLVRQLGFGWIEVFLPPTAPVQQFKILYRITLGQATSGKQEDIDQFARVVEGVARTSGDYIDAYSIGNEVNLSREWNGQPPDPALYARLLGIAYERIKALRPNAIVVSAGLAPTGGDGPGFMDDLRYARAMLAAGTAQSFDAYGFHPYGFASAPDADPAQAHTPGLAFRRAEAHHDLLAEFGAGDKQIWATEFGWLLDPATEGQSCAWPDMDWQKVSGEQQAQYTVDAIRYAREHWPWMGVMFLWNFDFSRSPLYPDTCEQMKWYSIISPQSAERPVVQALRIR
jgi:hypothetical protein